MVDLLCLDLETKNSPAVSPDCFAMVFWGMGTAIPIHCHVSMQRLGSGAERFIFVSVTRITGPLTNGATGACMSMRFPSPMIIG